MSLSGDDPRLGEPADALEIGVRDRPQVSGRRRSNLPLMVGAPAALGVIAFAWLSTHRPHPAATGGVATSAPAASVGAPPSADAAPPEVGALEAASRGGVAAPAETLPQPLPQPAAPPAMAYLTPTPMLPTAPAATSQSAPPAPKAGSPSIVIDLSEAPPSRPNATSQGDAKGSGPNGDELFASRVGEAEPERARATRLRGVSTLIPQGAMIPGVLETALDSDLPGYTRAVVSRDVRSFDGARVLIPRGSRVIGQYRSAAALGATRAFVIWTRVIRPDGASIQIGSSGADDLGRAGLAGKVDRHFLERFSGAVLLSVVSLGQAALSSGNSTQVVVGSSQDASALAGLAASTTPQAIAPTIKVKQGAAIRIFVARDLDFSAVEGGA